MADVPGDAPATEGGVTPLTNGVPQSPQKRLPAGLTAPHDGQPEASGTPQSPQKRLSAGFSVPQFEQTTRSAPHVTLGGRSVPAPRQLVPV